MVTQGAAHRISLGDATDGIEPEEQLLVCLARIDLPGKRKERAVGLIKDGIRWDQFVKLAIHHGVFPLVYPHLLRSDPLPIPRHVLWQIEAQLLVHCRRNQALKQEWVRLLSVFSQGGIPVIPVKGIILAESVYGDLSLRVFSDLDFHVRERDLSRCKRVLEADGYISTFPLDEFYELRTRKRRHELVLCKKNGGALPEIRVELQYALAPITFSLNIGPDQLFEDTKRVAVDGVETYRMSDESRIIYLCLHAWKHRWCRLKWICDIAEAINMGQVVRDEKELGTGTVSRSSTLNWERIIQRADSAGINRIMLHSLALAERLLDAKLPEWVTVELGRRSRGAYSRVWNTFSHHSSDEMLADIPFSGALPAEMYRDRFQRYRFWINYRERVCDKIRFLISLLGPNQTDCELVRLPPRFFPLYYILRPFLLGFKVLHRRSGESVESAGG